MVDFSINDHALAKLIDFIMNGEEDGPHGFVLVVVSNIAGAFETMNDAGIAVANCHLMSNLENPIAMRVLRAVLRADAKQDNEKEN